MAKVDLLKAFLDNDRHFSKKLAVRVAYHSAHMQEAAQELAGDLQGLDFEAGRKV
jgi:acyl transferase domain-containing protein